MNNSIDPFIHKKIIVLNQKEPAHIAARVMAEKGIGCVVISSGRGKILGLMTDRDLVRRSIAQGHDIGIPIGSLLTGGKLISVSPRTKLAEVLQLMEVYGVRRVPVIAGNGKTDHCEGLISLDDLIVAKKVSPDQLSRILRKQVRPKKIFQKLDRRKSRRDQTFGKFMRKIKSATGLEAGRAEAFVVSLLSYLVQRLPAEGAEQFLSQLPGVLQDSLYPSLRGHNRKLTADRMVKELQAEFDLTNNKTEKLAKDVWGVLREVTKSGEMDDVLSQLPPVFEDLLEYRVAVAPTEYGDYYEYYNG